MSVDTSIRTGGRQASGRRAGQAAGLGASGGSTVAIVFMVLLLIPINLQLGGLRLTPYRILLLIMFLPTFIRLVSGRAGAFLPADGLLIGYAVWSYLALLIVAGFGRGIEAGGIIFVETLGAYLLGRTLIASRHDFLRMSRTYFYLIVGLLPFAILESQTGQPILLDLIRKVMPTFPSIYQDKRLGLERAQVLFDHSILYGAWAAGAFGFVYYAVTHGKSLFGRIWNVALAFLAAFLSVSAGAIIAIAFQIMLIVWERFTRAIARRWLLLLMGALAFYILIDILSNRPPVHVFISYLSFNAESSYNRILIWNYGTDNVAQNPIFGLGFRDWVRPSWMGSSVDNFWLFTAMRYGLPAVIMLMLGVFFLMRRIGRVPMTDPLLKACRMGYMVSVGGMIFAGATVHYWNALYVWFLFLLGTGAWMISEPADGDAAPDPQGRRAGRASRRGPARGRGHEPSPDRAPEDPTPEPPGRSRVSPRRPRPARRRK